MNQRIRELMLEAGYAAPELAGRAIILVELIVRESVKILEEDNGATHHEELILEHFGLDQ